MKAPSVIVRRAKAADLPAMQAISNWAIEHTASHFGTEPESLESWQLSFAASQDRFPWLVYEVGGEVRGFAKATRYRERPAYAWTTEVAVYVHRDHRRKGAARALYAELLPILEAQGFQNAIAGITLPNDASVGLHRSMGFVQVGTIHRAGFKLGAWHDVSYWQRELAARVDAPSLPRRVSHVYPFEATTEA